jgi:DNA-directed RNA polymerase subunit RPC12/RpoP
MEQIVILKTSRDEYDIRESAKVSYSVEELIERLENFPKGAKIVFSNDNGHTFGSIDGGTIRILNVETEEEEKERIRKEEEEDEKTTLVCPNCGSDNIYWSVRGHMRCMSCDAKFNKAKKVTLA